MHATLDSHIECTSEIRSGKPRIAGSRITVSDVVLMHLRLGHSLEEIAGKYQFELSAVYAAMAYYFDHRADIDADMAREEGLRAVATEQNPSLLQQKLRELNGG